MPVHFEKSAWDAVQPRKDGLRILATRFWPRGLERAAVDLYLPDLAPSRELLQDRQTGEIDRRTFGKRYREEMKAQTSHLRTLNWLSSNGQKITVMCHCEKPEHCHRRILASLIEKAG